MKHIIHLLFLITLLGCALLSPTPTASIPTVQAPVPTKPLESELSPPTEAPPSDIPPTALPATDLPPPTDEPSPEITAISPESVKTFPDPNLFRWEPILYYDFENPLDLQHAGDERLFVVEQRGVIWVVEDGERIPEPFLDIQDIVYDGDFEQGLLGLAFHPSFADTGFFYVNYTDYTGDTVIARFMVSSDRNHADSDSRSVILSFDQPYSNHNGGGIAFGPDGYLYIGTGDGGSSDDPRGNGQKLDTLLGKLLRIDIDTTDPYAIPHDNPFTGTIRPEIWAFGIRNPWRFAFDRLTGDLFIADVGQDEWEEVNFQPAETPGGINYGWNVREGLHPFAGSATEGLIDPIAEYGHDQGCSVTGGVVVRDPSLPEWSGVYLYGDYCTGILWGLVRNADGQWENRVLYDTDFVISSFGEDRDGHVYLVDHGGWVFRLERQ